MVDYYIRIKEDSGEKAAAISAEKVAQVKDLYRGSVAELSRDLATRTNFYELGTASYDEALRRALYFKDYIEKPGRLPSP